MLERGVSLARIRYAFNSTNVEGWACTPNTSQALHAAGRTTGLAGLPLLRAARAFLDPELQSGKIKPEEAYRVLSKT